MRVALVGCSGLLGDIIGQAVADDPGLEVVAEIGSAEFVAAGLGSVEADIVLWNRADESRLWTWLKAAAGRGPRVLATLGDGRDASLWELTPRRTELGDLSPTSLCEALRGSAPEGHP
ncbi:MAG: hypothetical protein M3237_15130 [Actinomycetota bacterium]|nr:hypothetical protein [Actinomycetota bacterium]